MTYFRKAAPSSQPLAYSDSSLNHISLEYPYAELQQATRNFDTSMKLGSGSYGGVFRGILTDGTEVAIKVLDVPDEAGFEEEVKVLSKFRHPHLVILMGFARHGTQRLLVYELLAGGDLHKRLQRSCVEGLPFPWQERVSIALDSACGLSHLHHAKPKVFHRDIKSPNILLDKNGTAKMADFGLACLSHASAHRVKQASGTVGYACPLYVQRGVVTEGSEVYSFGMVLLELLTASPPAYVAQSGSAGANQVQYLAHHINGDVRVALSLADVRAGWQPAAARAIAELALSCTVMQEERRPGFTEIVRTLRAIHDGSGLQAPTGPLAGRTHPHGAPSPGPQPAAAASMRPTARQPGQAPAPCGAGAHPGPVGAAAGGGSVTAAAQLPAAAVALALGADTAEQRGLWRPARPVIAPASPPSAAATASPWPMAPQGAAPARPQSPPARAQSPPRHVGLPLSPHAASQPRRAVQATAPSNSALAAASKLDRTRIVQGSTVPSASPPLALHREVQRAEKTAGVSVSVAPAPTSVPPDRDRTAEPAAGPLLFALECIYAETANFHSTPQEQRLIVHRSISPESAAPLHVGRAFQRGLFDCFSVPETARSISREHFQVWAEEVVSQPTTLGDRIPCMFYLANLSCNGTHVNEEHLQVQGEQTALHHGDVISLSRPIQVGGCTYHSKFIRFRFDLTESCLRETDWAEKDGSAPSEETWSSSDGDQQQDSCINGMNAFSTFYNGEPVLVLEVCGPGAREQVPVERRRIAYAPPEADKDCLRLYSSLVIGRAHQLNFWQEILHEEAFTALSRQHFEVQTWRSTSASRFSFLVQNLSDVNPLHVQSGPKEMTETPVALSKGEQRHLLDGDKIVLNLNHTHTFWLIFRDLTESTSMQFTSFLSNEEVKTSPDVETMPLSTVVVGRSPSGPSRHSSGQRRLPGPGDQQRPRHQASVLHPPFPFLPTDEDEISTAATPHDLHQEEEEENDGDFGRGFMMRSSSLRPGASSSDGSLPQREAEGDCLRSGSGPQLSLGAVARTVSPEQPRGRSPILPVTRSSSSRVGSPQLQQQQQQPRLQQPQPQLQQPQPQPQEQEAGTRAWPPLFDFDFDWSGPGPRPRPGPMGPGPMGDPSGPGSMSWRPRSPLSRGSEQREQQEREQQERELREREQQQECLRELRGEPRDSRGVLAAPLPSTGSSGGGGLASLSRTETAWGWPARGSAQALASEQAYPCLFVPPGQALHDSCRDARGVREDRRSGSSFPTFSASAV